MQIHSVEIKNLRSIREVRFNVHSFTALIGGNNAGKSTILKAIELFFDPSPKISPDDFSKRNIDSPIEVTLEFTNLTPLERSEFGSACIGGTLSVTRIFSLEGRDSHHYHVRAMVYPGFDEIRNETNGTQKRAKHNQTADTLEGLERVSSFQEVESALTEWERNNPDQLEARRVRGFFGAPNVANGKLKKKTGIYLIPAVRDASDEAADPRKSPTLALLNEIAKQTFENKKEVVEFIERTKKEFTELVDPASIAELSAIGDRLSDSVQRFYPEARLEAVWESQDGLTLNYPSPRLMIQNNGMTTDLSRVGHGLQRAALFSIVQFLAENRHSELTETEFSEAASDIIILVEEPEIYQHPNKQIVIYEALKRITSAFNRISGIRIQVIYTTHSEKFIKLADFNAARIVRSTRLEGEITNSVTHLTIAACSSAFANFANPPKQAMSNEAFTAKLHIFTREVCEGFFADKVLLVEGSTDRAIIHAIFQSRSRDPYSEGVSIISVDGKSKMDKPAFIFRSLGIPTFMIFDNDESKSAKKQKPDTNILLQKIAGVPNPVEWPRGLNQGFYAFPCDLETYLKGRMGKVYDELFQEVAISFGVSYEEIKKTPHALVEVFTRASRRGVDFPELDELVAHFGSI